ncbi:glycoside hydrolase family 66 protein [Pontibacillus salicampi]|uniref:Glycoside hydrolase family 66 protein n=1 Tax=Pontibacillus salicampi TaxID=1449801 RepID=A0ABV6LSK3_9BACI
MNKRWLLPAIFLGILILLIIPARFLWSEDESFEAPNEKNPVGQDINVTSISKDKSRYSPESTVAFEASFSEKPEHSMDVKIVYYHQDEIVHEKIVQASEQTIQWKWKTPKEDYKGYYVEVVPLHNTSGGQTIALDVSSSWDKFPRYGFLSDFSNKEEKKLQTVIDTLNRYHINGLQFYDWQDEHHLPLKTKDGEPRQNWANIAGEPVSFSTIESYIDLAHQHNMQAMSYNLLYGTLEDAEEDGVREEWSLYTDEKQQERDRHDLPDDWKSDIFLANPANKDWQDYLLSRQQTVFNQLSFDGWHIDQLGERGEVYDVEGNKVDLAGAFDDFLQKSEQAFPDKSLVMNAVNQYGQKEITSSSIPFTYSELWDPIQTYQDMKDVLVENQELTDYEKSTVLAAYMNYDKSNKEGSFNPASILYTDALIFAHGGAHIELGEHMLSKEYFPHNKLEMPNKLKEDVTSYYDFMVAYENVLRDEVKPTDLQITTPEWVQLSQEPEEGKLYTFAKEKEGQKIVHVLNYFNATHMNWRDTSGTQHQPAMKQELNLSIKEDKKVKKVWVASPDWNNGLPSQLDFNQENGSVSITLPKIQYWDMIVMEY